MASAANSLSTYRRKRDFKKTPEPAGRRARRGETQFFVVHLHHARARHFDATAAYEDGRTGAWLKVKCVQSDKFAIVGFTAGQGAREQLSSLLLATPAATSTWRYMGRLGTGFSARVVADLLKRMRGRRESVRPENPPARAQLRGARPAWVNSTLVVEVKFRGYTGDGLLRHASLKGVRSHRGISSPRPGRRDKASVEAEV